MKMHPLVSRENLLVSYKFRAQFLHFMKSNLIAINGLGHFSDGLSVQQLWLVGNHCYVLGYHEDELLSLLQAKSWRNLSIPFKKRLENVVKRSCKY